MKRSIAFFGLGLLVAITLLSSCFYPERFNATLNIDSPWFPGLSKTYEWQFSLSTFSEPWMLLQLEGRVHK